MLAVAVPQRLVRLVVIVLEARLVRLIDVTALGLPTLHAVSVWATTPMSTSALEVTSSVALTALFLPPSSSGLSCFLFLWPFFSPPPLLRLSLMLSFPGSLSLSQTHTPSLSLSFCNQS